MGFSSSEAKSLVQAIQERDLLDRGSGRLVLELARKNGMTVHEAGAALLRGLHWEELGA